MIGPDSASAWAGDAVVEGALAAVRQVLAMDAAYLAEFTDGRQVYRAIRATLTRSGWGSGTVRPPRGFFRANVGRVAAERDPRQLVGLARE